MTNYRLKLSDIIHLKKSGAPLPRTLKPHGNLFSVVNHSGVRQAVFRAKCQSNLIKPNQTYSNQIKPSPPAYPPSRWMWMCPERLGFRHKTNFFQTKPNKIIPIDSATYENKDGYECRMRCGCLRKACINI